MVKKLIQKIRKKSPETPSRITNNTIDEHREEILAKGRRFKYPMQYAKYKLVINTIIISVLAIATACTIIWFQLYRAQSTHDVLFRITQVVPLRVADVDGQRVLFSDYLMQLRSSITVFERQMGRLEDSEDSRRQLEYFKRIAMDNAQKNAYVIRLARELDITISRDRIQEVFNEHRRAGGVEVTEQNFIRIIQDNYGLSKAEYERMFIELPLLKQEVQIAIDDHARTTAEELQRELALDGSNFDLVTGQFSDLVQIESSNGFVPVTNLDGGRAAHANTLEVGTVSEPFLSRSGDSFFIVKLLQRQDDRVEYISIRITFTELQYRMDQLRADGRIREFITIDFQFDTQASLPTLRPRFN